jgi:tetratricopeptide (TPR) repeat protein
MMWRASVIFLIRAAAVVGAVLAIDQLCVQPFRGNLLLRDIEQRSVLAQTLEPTRAKALAHTNLHDLDVGARGRRLDPEWYLLYGANCEIVERWSDAADAYTRALQIDQRPEIYVNRGLVMLHMGAADAAVADLATAARFDPTIIEQLDGELRVRVAKAAGLR